jgi:hypothetical protein
LANRIEFVFVWDEDTQSWVATIDTIDKKRISQSVPINAETDIEGARRERQGNRDFLFIPKSKAEELYEIAPNFRPGKELTLRVAEKGIELFEESTQKVGETLKTQPDLPTSTRVGQKVGKLYKAKEEVPIGSYLPGSDRPASKIQIGETSFDYQRGNAFSAMTPKDRPFSGIPSPQSYSPIIGIDVSGDLNAPVGEGAVIPGSELGQYIINTQDESMQGREVLFLVTPGSKASTPLDATKFYFNLLNLTPDEVIAYKKALGYKNPTAIIDNKFRDDVMAEAREVSQINYENAIIGNREQIGLENWISSGGTAGGAGAGGISVNGTTVTAREVRARTETIQLLETELGVELSENQRRRLALDYASGAIDANTIRANIAKVGKVDFATGQAATLINNLKENAAANGIQFSNDWFEKAAQNVLTGQSTEEDFNNEIKNQAKMLYAAPSIQQAIDAGFTVRQQASPYINYLAQIRGVDPNSISLNDGMVSKALTARNEKGEPYQMSYYDWQNYVKETDPDYASSDFAQEAYGSALRSFGRLFGKSI